jgi:hypothetical protein
MKPVKINSFIALDGRMNEKS